MTSPEVVFAELQATAPTRPGRAFRSFDAPAGLQIRAFIDGMSRLPGVSFRLARQRVPNDLQLPRMRGATVLVTADSGGRAAEVTYEIAASGIAFSEVFVELAARLISEAAAEGTAESAMSRMAHRAAIWARFFDNRAAQGPGRAGQLGLIGELLCLRRLVSLVGSQPAVDAWTGRVGTIHDFQTKHGAIEAKLTTSAAPERLRISSERQLDTSQVPLLLMFAVLAQETQSGLVGVPVLVDQIRAATIADSASTAVLEDKLLEAGYVDVDRASYDVRVSVREAAFLHVDAGFPRIRPADLCSGVSGVAYDVSWSAIAPYRITDNEVSSVFGGHD